IFAPTQRSKIIRQVSQIFKSKHRIEYPESTRTNHWRWQVADEAKLDFKSGIPLASLADGGMLAGQVDGEEILLVRRGDEYFAVGAHCTHYHGPLAEGLVVGD